jgi:hypothetical protein
MGTGLVNQVRVPMVVSTMGTWLGDEDAGQGVAEVEADAEGDAVAVATAAVAVAVVVAVGVADGVPRAPAEWAGPHAARSRTAAQPAAMAA